MGRVLVAALLVVVIVGQPVAAQTSGGTKSTDGFVIAPASGAHEAARTAWVASGGRINGVSGFVIELDPDLRGGYRLEVTSDEATYAQPHVEMYSDIEKGVRCTAYTPVSSRPVSSVCGTHAIVAAQTGDPFTFRFTEAAWWQSVFPDDTGVVTPIPDAPAVARHLNPAHDGAHPKSVAGKATLEPAWVTDLDGPDEYGQVSAPLIVGGRVFVAHHPQSSSSSRLVSLDAVSGAVKWEVDASSIPELAGGADFSTPAYDGGRVYVSALSLTLAFDADDGTHLWTHTSSTNSMGLSGPPTAMGGRVYVSAESDGTAALDGATGAVLWRQPVASSRQTTPAVTADGVYVTSECITRRLRPSDGEVVWERRSSCDRDAFPVVTPSHVFTRHGADRTSSDVLTTLRGERAYTHVSQYAPAVGDGRAYYGGSGTIYAADERTGQRLWRYEQGAYVRHDPILVNGTLYVIAGLHGQLTEVHAIDPKNGLRLWHTQLSSADDFGGSYDNGLGELAAGEGMLVASSGGAVHAYRSVTIP